MKQYPPDEIEFVKQEALDWLAGRSDGYPRSWAEEAARQARGVTDESDVPTIAGYEALEKEGLVVRVGTIKENSVERVHFRLKDTPTSAPDGGTT